MPFARNWRMEKQKETLNKDGISKTFKNYEEQNAL